MTQPKPELAKRTILVVDDEKNIRRTLSLVLEGEGYRVLTAETAKAALAILRDSESPVDLAILDVKLPDMSGLEALELIRKDEATRELPIVVISGHATLDDAARAIELGASPRASIAMMKAAQVDAVEIAPEDDLDNAQRRLDDLTGWLGRHGVTARGHATVAGVNDADAFDAIVADRDADIVVAGAYGHSRAREWALGGVTRTLLRHPIRSSFVSH